MNKTKIEWTDYTSNPVKGYCPMPLSKCPLGKNCYARGMYDRFGWDKTIRFDPNEHCDWVKVKSGERVFVGSTIELFGEWIPYPWMACIMEAVRCNPQATFIFLTKCPENLSKFNPWPDNAWVGVSVIADGPMTTALTNLGCVEAPVRFLSFEPLLGAITMRSHPMKGIVDWIIIGAQTNPYKPPRQEWVQEIIDAADRAGIPVFLKDNLHWAIQRREWTEALSADSEAFNHDVIVT